MIEDVRSVVSISDTCVHFKTSGTTADEVHVCDGRAYALVPAYTPYQSGVNRVRTGALREAFAAVRKCLACHVPGRLPRMALAVACGAPPYWSLALAAHTRHGQGGHRFSCTAGLTLKVLHTLNRHRLLSASLTLSARLCESTTRPTLPRSSRRPKRRSLRGAIPPP